MKLKQPENDDGSGLTFGFSRKTAKNSDLLYWRKYQACSSSRSNTCLASQFEAVDCQTIIS